MNEVQSGRTGFLKSTLIGGVFFLIPLVIVVAILGKAGGLMKGIAVTLYPNAPIESMMGVVILNLIALVGLLAICFVAGLVAQRAAARKVTEKIESLLLGMMPGYTFVKAFADNMAASDRIAERFLPVMVQFDAYGRLGFEIERFGNGEVSVYLPGTPNPWSGSIIYVAQSRCQRLPVDFPKAVSYCRTLGNPSAELSRILRASKAGDQAG